MAARHPRDAAHVNAGAASQRVAQERADAGLDVRCHQPAAARPCRQERALAANGGSTGQRDRPKTGRPFRAPAIPATSSCSGLRHALLPMLDRSSKHPATPV